ncbi:MAG: GNAT family N-acetyltransferase [Gammaproteobacteria bacterium]
MKLEISQRGMADFDKGDWNRVSGVDYPFLRYEFLSALETQGCVGEQHGWIPQHMAAYDDQNQLTGLLPFYLKNNSYGEFVFDWSWADAYQRNGLPYYPKGLVSVPYTPAKGPRILTHTDCDEPETKKQLIELSTTFATEQHLSSLHFLFLEKADREQFNNEVWLQRSDIQFHWENRNYTNFDDFLSRLNSRKRKKIKRERRQVVEAGIDIQVVSGSDMTEEQWRIMHEFYCSTFDKKSGYPTFSLSFFQEISATMGSQIVLIFAYHESKAVAGAIFFRSNDTLYGRHWGCNEEFHSLHFEVCYYQGIEYCIQQGLQRFEPGAQGEHKISRGFLPMKTHSMHWIAHDDFRRAINRHLVQERHAINEYYSTLQKQSPYKTALDRQ